MLNLGIQQEIARKYGAPIPQQLIKKALQESLQAHLPSGVTDFDEHAAVAYIDIAGFSERVRGRSAREVREYLDRFYGVAVRSIYSNYGHIDRIAGDGIVAVFNKTLSPELDDATAEVRAMLAAEKAVSELYGSDAAAKGAVSVGPLYFCRTGLEGFYEDFTVVGEPITVAYRMEEAAKVNQVWIQADTQVGQFVDEQIRRGGYRSDATWNVTSEQLTSKGAHGIAVKVQEYRGQT